MFRDDLLEDEDPVAVLQQLLLVMLSEVELEHGATTTLPELAMLMATTQMGRALAILLCLMPGPDDKTLADVARIVGIGS